MFFINETWIHKSDTHGTTYVATARDFELNDDGTFSMVCVKVFSCPDGYDFQTVSRYRAVRSEYAAEAFRAFGDWGGDGTLLTLSATDRVGLREHD